jgi:hypothetical protein
LLNGAEKLLQAAFEINWRIAQLLDVLAAPTGERGRLLQRINIHLSGPARSVAAISAPHSKERFANRAEVPAIQRLLAFRRPRRTARFDRRPTLRLAVAAPAARSRACENPHEY